MTLKRATCRYNEENAGEAGPARLAVPSVRGELPVSLALRHSGEISTIIRYEIVGPDDRPLLIVGGGISAGRHVASTERFAEPGWWEAQKTTLADDSFRLLAIDWLGADGTIDGPIDAADQARAIASLLDELGVGKAAAFIGASYGAMVAMHFAAQFPDRLGAILAISAADRSHPYSSAQRSLQRQALSLGERAGDPEAGIALARAMAMLTYRTAEEFAERFTDEPNIAANRVRVGADSYLAAQGARHCKRMSATAYRRLSESIDLHRVDASQIGVPLTLVAVDQDRLVPASDVQSLAAAVKGAQLRFVHSRFGHDAFLKEEEQIAAIISEFLSSLEPRS